MSWSIELNFIINIFTFFDCMILIITECFECLIWRTCSSNSLWYYFSYLSSLEIGVISSFLRSIGVCSTCSDAFDLSSPDYEILCMRIIKTSSSFSMQFFFASTSVLFSTGVSSTRETATCSGVVDFVICAAKGFFNFVDCIYQSISSLYSFSVSTVWYSIEAGIFFSVISWLIRFFRS